jgi:hypothetical protein
MKYPTPPINRYGKIIRYTIPLFIPLAAPPPSSLSNTALHIAHCASAESVMNSNRIRKRKKALNFMVIDNKVKS